MTHRILALALCMHGACAMAQIPIQVGDADAKPVPYAHLAWQCIGSEGHGLVVMDAQGKGAVPFCVCVLNCSICDEIGLLKLSEKSFSSVRPTISQIVVNIPFVNVIRVFRFSFKTGSTFIT